MTGKRGLKRLASCLHTVQQKEKANSVYLLKGEQDNGREGWNCLSKELELDNKGSKLPITGAIQAEAGCPSVQHALERIPTSWRRKIWWLGLSSLIPSPGRWFLHPQGWPESEYAPLPHKGLAMDNNGQWKPRKSLLLKESKHTMGPIFNPPWGLNTFFTVDTRHVTHTVLGEQVLLTDP